MKNLYSNSRYSEQEIKMKARSGIMWRHVNGFPNRESLILIFKQSLSWFIIIVTTLAGSMSMGHLAFIGSSIPILWASSAFSYLSEWGKRPCSTRGQKRGFSVWGAKERPSSLPAFFQSISVYICAISCCITEEKSEMPEISCVAFFISLLFEAGGFFVVRFCKPPGGECWDSPVMMGFLWLLLFWQC